MVSARSGGNASPRESLSKSHLELLRQKVWPSRLMVARSLPPWARVKVCFLSVTLGESVRSQLKETRRFRRSRKMANVFTTSFAASQKRLQTSCGLPTSALARAPASCQDFRSQNTTCREMDVRSSLQKNLEAGLGFGWPPRTDSLRRCSSLRTETIRLCSALMA